MRDHRSPSERAGPGPPPGEGGRTVPAAAATVRLATEADAALLARAEAETARTPGLLVGRPGEIPASAYAEKIRALREAGRYVVAEVDGQVVGHAFLDPMGLEAVAHVFRLTIVVHSGWSGRGIGSRLMVDLLDWAEGDARVGKVELLVRAVNHRAVALYRRFGFIDEGRLVRRVKLPDGRFTDDLAMAWFPPRDARHPGSSPRNEPELPPVPTGRVLEPFAEGLFTVTRPQRYWGVEVGTRMTVVALSDGGLFIHGPVGLDPALREAVDALGAVRAVVCSSRFHHLYAGEWMRAYPGAMFCACPGLETKRRDLRWDHVLGSEPHPIWAADLDQVYLSARFEHEVVFFHKRTRTLVCLDALLNLSRHPRRSTRWVARLMGNTGPGKGYLERVAVRDRAAARDEARRILGWDIEGIILAHGGLVHRDGRRLFREAYAWLGL